jgi:uncharacterized phage infection (PIP) family protein YhgE
VKSFFIKLFKILFLFLILAASLILFLQKTGRINLNQKQKNLKEVLSDPRELVREIKNESQDIIAGNACSRPFTYSIGNVDPKFGISQENFLKTVVESEKIWEDAMGMNIFEYDPKSEFKINLVYDERQQMSDEAKKINQELSGLKQNINTLDSKYNSLKATYEKKAKSYQSAVAGYNKDAKNYQKDVEYWNLKGGAPKDEFERLQNKQSSLEKQLENLESRKKELDKLADEVNSLASKENKTVANYNQNIETYKNKFGASREFEKGVYSGGEINIYQYNEISDLRLTLSHELGHARGIGHVENSKSLMYYLMSDQDINKPSLTNEDIFAIKSICY